MTDTIIVWFTAASHLFDLLLSNTRFGAVVEGSFCAIGMTQLVKMMVIHSNIPNGPWRVWYLTTAITGLLSTLLLWPSRQAVVWGLIAGTLFAPLIYLAGTRALYKFWPELEEKISATPKLKP